MLELLQMWAIMEVLGMVCFPLTFTVFHNLPDRGWAFSKAVGLSVLAFCVWLPLMCIQVLPFSQFFILGILLILVALNVPGFLSVRKTLLEWLRSHLVYIVVVELIFLGMTFLLGWLRAYGPDIRNFEMFMDEGFLAGIMRSAHFPPADMWYAGQPINYYYYAHYTIALLAKLLGQSPSVAFNTGICMFFGLTAVNLFGVTANVVAWAQHRRQHAGRLLAAIPLGRAVPYGILSLLLGVVLGNLAATQTWWQSHGDLPDFYWFNASRVIVNTINEFPAFSFLLSCFHAHVLALAFTIVALALAFNLFLEPEGQGLQAFGQGWRLPLTLGVTALMIGSLFAMNGWDYPTYLALTLVALLLQQWLAHRSRLSWDLVLDAFTVCAALGALSFFLFTPFYISFVSPAQGLGLLGPTDRTPLADEILIYGIFAFIFLSLLLATFFRPRASLALASGGPASSPGAAEQLPEPEPAPSSPVQVGVSGLARVEAAPEARSLDAEASRQVQALEAQEEAEAVGFANLNWRDVRIGGLVGILLLSLVVGVILKNSLTFVVTGALAALGSLLTLYHLRERERAFVLLLGAVACALIAFCEVVFLRDVFAGQVPRMNTVFKFYFQAWALLSVAGGAGVYFVLDSLRPSTKFLSSARRTYVASGVLWSAALLVFLLMGAVYPLTAAYQRYGNFTQRDTSLDGLNYLRSYAPGDYAAIRWIDRNITGDPAIVEAFGSDYTDYGRISAFTGLPTIMGWEGHEWQWRVNWVSRGFNSADFFRRIGDINQIYTSNAAQTVLTLMAHYGARYLYVGALEQATYVGVNLQRFGSFLNVVYQSDGVTIYHVPG
ncbi:MAG TPA: DUF2298 domain-containing protein [Ktedonobacteraceae bacterium]|jgi:YYY domain-containing protein